MTEDDNSFKRLYRSDEDRVIAGICGGFGEYFNIDPVIVRLIWIGLSIVHGFGLVLYLLCWVFIPRRPWSSV